MATRITQRGKHGGAHRRARVRTLTAPPLAEGRLRNNRGQIVEGHDDVSQHRDRVFIEVAYRSEQFAGPAHQRNAVITLIALLLWMPIDARVLQGMLHAERLSGALDKNAVRFRDR